MVTITGRNTQNSSTDQRARREAHKVSEKKGRTVSDPASLAKERVCFTG